MYKFKKRFSNVIIKANNSVGNNIWNLFNPDAFIIINSLSVDNLWYTKIHDNAKVIGVKKGNIVGISNDVIDTKLKKSKPLFVIYSINFRDIMSHIKLIKKSVI